MWQNHFIEKIHLGDMQYPSKGSNLTVLIYKENKKFLETRQNESEIPSMCIKTEAMAEKTFACGVNILE